MTLTQQTAMETLNAEARKYIDRAVAADMAHAHWRSLAQAKHPLGIIVTEHTGRFLDISYDDGRAVRPGLEAGWGVGVEFSLTDSSEPRVYQEWLGDNGLGAASLIPRDEHPQVAERLTRLLLQVA